MSDINSAHQGFPVLKALNDATSIPAIKNTHTISVSPNPATDIITITGLQINESITIHDLSGKLVLSRKAVGATENFAVGGLPKGVYLVGIAGQTVKLVKK
jgi:proteasome assembly chaperone (PAC2) family protein